MDLSFSKSRYIQIYVFAIAAYIGLSFTPVIEFDLLWLAAVSNLAVLPAVFHRFRSNEIVDPMSHIVFSEGRLSVGNDTFALDKVKKVVLDQSGGYGYFGLPFNQKAPGKVTEFRFPESKFEELKAYLEDGFGKTVSFIT